MTNPKTTQFAKVLEIVRAKTPKGKVSCWQETNFGFKFIETFNLISPDLHSHIVITLRESSNVFGNDHIFDNIRSNWLLNCDDSAVLYVINPADDIAAIKEAIGVNPNIHNHEFARMLRNVREAMNEMIKRFPENGFRTQQMQQYDEGLISGPDLLIDIINATHPS